jgi:PPOX class probable F420-dependent enzyme
MAFALTDRIEQHLNEDLVAWLTTVTPSGRPAPRVVWFVWNGTEIVMYSQSDSAKLRHIEANDQVTVNFNCSAEGSDVVVIGGRAGVLPDAPPPSNYPGLIDKYAARMENMGVKREWYDDSYRVALRIVPERSWTIPR